MLRPFCIVVLLTLTAVDACPQTPPETLLREAPDLFKPVIYTWTLSDGKSMEASIVSAKEDQVTMLVRTTAPMAAFDASSKARMLTLSKLPPEKLFKYQQSPENWVSASGKAVSAVFESVSGDKVTLLVRKQFAQSAFDEASSLQLQSLLDKVKVPSMDLGGFEVPSMSLTMEPDQEMDLTAKPDIGLDLANKSPQAIELDKYKYQAKPIAPKKPSSKSQEANEREQNETRSAKQNEEQAKLLARQQQRVAANRRIASFMSEFEALYSQRGDSEKASEQWTQKYDDFLRRLEQARHLDREDLIAYSALAIAAAAVERRDHRAVVTNLLMLSEFLVRSR